MTELAIGIILGCCALGAGIAMIAGIGPGHRRRQCRGKGVRGHRPPAGVQRKRYNHHADGLRPLRRPPAFTRWLSPFC